MQRRLTLAALTLILAFVLPLGAGAQQPPRPAPRHVVTLANQTMAGPFDMILQVVDFAPGNWTSVHAHGGPTFILVIDGTVTYRAGGADTAFSVGQSWLEPANELGAVGNLGTAPASIAAGYLIPAGAAVTTPAADQPQPPAPRPTLRAQVRLDGVTQAGAFDEALAVADYPPGAAGPLHSHPAPILVVVVEGELTLREQGRVPRVVKSGESWIERAGDVHDVVNAGSAKATLVAQQIVPQGAAPSTPVTAPAPTTPGLPATGEGGGAPRPPASWLVALAGCGLATSGWLLRQRRRGARHG
jgi:quercetin dioxygenase-like cupin family protein